MLVVAATGAVTGAAAAASKVTFFAVTNQQPIDYKQQVK